MAATYTEKRDSQGRVQVELADHQPAILWGVLGIPLLVYLDDVTLKMAVIFTVLGMLILGAIYFFTRKRVQVLLNPGARTLVVAGRVVKMDDVLTTRIDSKEVSYQESTETWYRIELLLRSSEIVSLTPRHARFKREDCQRLVARIEMAIHRNR